MSQLDLLANAAQDTPDRRAIRNGVFENSTAILVNLMRALDAESDFTREEFWSLVDEYVMKQRRFVDLELEEDPHSKFLGAG